MTVKLVSNEKIAETSSKGNQEKWLDRETDCWYKLDQFGYEALAETLISQLRARPFQTTFTRQMNTARGLYGRQLVMPKLSRGEVVEELQTLLSFYPERDRGIITDRVWACISIRQKAM